MRYQYIGKEKIMLIGYGLVNPNDEIEVNFEITNDNFKKIEKKKKKS